MKPLSYRELLDAFTEPGCPICRLLERDVAAYLSSLLYDRFMTPETHDAFSDGLGLCNHHSWGLIDQGNALAVATLYAGVLDKLLVAMGPIATEQGAKSGLGRLLGSGSNAGGALADALEPGGPCLACEHRLDAEGRYAKTFSQHVAEDEWQAAYKASDGLCLPHFRIVLGRTRRPKHLEALIAIQLEMWTKLRADLELYREKSDYRRAGERMGAEGDSWRRAIRAMAGELHSKT